MPEPHQIRIELIKLMTGERLLRLSEPLTGLSLEKLIDKSRPVVRQKNELMNVFQGALDRASLSVA